MSKRSMKNVAIAPAAQSPQIASGHLVPLGATIATKRMRLAGVKS